MIETIYTLLDVPAGELPGRYLDEDGRAWKVRGHGHPVKLPLTREQVEAQLLRPVAEGGYGFDAVRYVSLAEFEAMGD